MRKNQSPCIWERLTNTLFKNYRDNCPQVSYLSRSELSERTFGSSSKLFSKATEQNIGYARKKLEENTNKKCFMLITETRKNDETLHTLIGPENRHCPAAKTLYKRELARRSTRAIGYKKSKKRLVDNATALELTGEEEKKIK